LRAFKSLLLARLTYLAEPKTEKSKEKNFKKTKPI